jgi:hypothetical protein
LIHSSWAVDLPEKWPSSWSWQISASLDYCSIEPTVIQAEEKIQIYWKKSFYTFTFLSNRLIHVIHNTIQSLISNFSEFGIQLYSFTID